MHEIRTDAQQVCARRRERGALRRERAAAAPAHLVLPGFAAVALIGTSIVVSSAAGLPPVAVLAIAGLVAVAGACVAHRAVGSVLAGLILLLARPYGPGERVRMLSPDQGELIEVEVVRIGLANTVVATRQGVLTVANTHLLRGLPAAPDAA